MTEAKGGRSDTRRNLQLLIALRGILCSDGDVESKLTMVADEVARSVADYCIVDLMAPSGEVRRLKIAHADASQLENLNQSAAAFVSKPGGRVARAFAKSTGAELVVAGRTKRPGADDTEFDFVRATPVSSFVQAPVLAAGETVALLTFLATKRRPFDEAALALFREIAGWCGLYVEKALFEAASRGRRRSGAARPG